MFQNIQCYFRLQNKLQIEICHEVKILCNIKNVAFQIVYFKIEIN